MLRARTCRMHRWRRRASRCSRPQLYHFGSYPTGGRAGGIDYSSHNSAPLDEAAHHRDDQAGPARRQTCMGRGDPSGATSSPRRVCGASAATVRPMGRALHAAGLDRDEVACYRPGTRTQSYSNSVAAPQMKTRLTAGVQRDDPGLPRGGRVRYFGSFDKALPRRAHDPAKHRQRRAWTPARVVARHIKELARSNGQVTDPLVRRTDPACSGAGSACFGELPKPGAPPASRNRRDGTERASSFAYPRGCFSNPVRLPSARSSPVLCFASSRHRLLLRTRIGPQCDRIARPARAILHRHLSAGHLLHRPRWICFTGSRFRFQVAKDRRPRRQLLHRLDMRVSQVIDVNVVRALRASGVG